MMGPGFAEFIILILVYIAGAMLMTVMVGIGIALGLRWGGKWLLETVYSNPEFESWLKRVLNAPEKPDQ